ncbi:MAG: YibE/F family protein [Pseudonocardiaceae bacterium]
MSRPDHRAGRHRDRGATEPAGSGHGHGPVAPSARPVKLLLIAVLVPFALATLIGVGLTWPDDEPQRSGADLGFGQRPAHGEILEVASAPCTSGLSETGGPETGGPETGGPETGGPETGGPETGGGAECIALTVRLTDSSSVGTTIRQVLPDEPSTPRFTVGDEIVLAYNGGDPGDELSYQVVDFQRGAPMLWLVALFAVAVLLLGRWKGLASLVALGFSFLVLVVYLFPAILGGADPVIAGVLAASVIMFGVLYLSHGFSAQTSTAVLGTLLSLVLIGVLGTAFAAATRLTGLEADTQNLIGVLGHGIDTRGLLLAGLIIGALGVLDDVTVTQTSAVWELRRANPDLGALELYRSALRIGRDHISSAVNTLALVYAGAALPVLLAFSVSGQTFGTLVTAQDVAQEVVLTLVGSIGLVAAVPITTAIGALVALREDIDPATQR